MEARRYSGLYRLPTTDTTAEAQAPTVRTEGGRQVVAMEMVTVTCNCHLGYDIKCTICDTCLIGLYARLLNEKWACEKCYEKVQIARELAERFNEQYG